jgi:hypothetical protein
VKSRAHLEPQSFNVFRNRAGGPHSASGPVESGQEPIAGGVNLTAAEMREPLSDEGMVRFE